MSSRHLSLASLERLLAVERYRQAHQPPASPHPSGIGQRTEPPSSPPRGPRGSAPGRQPPGGTGVV